MKCRYCHTRVANSQRGLCRTCCDVPVIRKKFKPIREGGNNRGLGNENGPSRTPTRITKALPGSAMKIRAMRGRIARGEGLFHRDDGPTEAELT